MNSGWTYGDHLTLLALVREYSCQCLVLSAAGLEYISLISNDGIFDRNLMIITLGHFPGIHHAGVKIGFDFEAIIEASSYNQEHDAHIEHL